MLLMWLDHYHRLRLDHLHWAVQRQELRSHYLAVAAGCLLSEIVTERYKSIYVKGPFTRGWRMKLVEP